MFFKKRIDRKDLRRWALIVMIGVSKNKYEDWLTYLKTLFPLVLELIWLFMYTQYESYKERMQNEINA